MDDFSAKPGAPNAFGLTGGEANEIAPGKRPLSSMTPTIVLKNGVPYLVTGSPGGSTIITVVLQELLNVLTFDMNVAEATAAPRIHHQWLPDKVLTERGISDDTLRLLQARGFILPMKPDGSYEHVVLGRANSVMKAAGLYFGAADTRDGDGAAAGVLKFVRMRKLPHMVRDRGTCRRTRSQRSETPLCAMHRERTTLIQRSRQRRHLEEWALLKPDLPAMFSNEPSGVKPKPVFTPPERGHQPNRSRLGTKLLR